jgi:hypothetical protein
MLEPVLAMLAWASFGLGAAGVLGLCAFALFAEPAMAPEQFLVRLAIILASSLVPTSVFRLLAALGRRRRARNRADGPGILGSLAPLGDSTLGQ